MREQGEPIAAERFMGDGEFRGILIFSNRSIEEVRELARPDPVLQTRRLLLEVHELHTPAGLRVVSAGE